VPVIDRGSDRVLYHAACALAANGLVVLRFFVDAVFAAAGGLAPKDARLLADALMATALRSSSELGAAAALSGPVRRGDAATVHDHLAALQVHVPGALEAYRALMLGAVVLAESRGLPAAAAAALRDTLGTRGGSGHV